MMQQAIHLTFIMSILLQQEENWNHVSKDFLDYRTNFLEDIYQEKLYIYL